MADVAGVALLLSVFVSILSSILIGPCSNVAMAMTAVAAWRESSGDGVLTQKWRSEKLP